MYRYCCGQSPLCSACRPLCVTVQAWLEENRSLLVRAVYPYLPRSVATRWAPHPHLPFCRFERNNHSTSDAVGLSTQLRQPFSSSRTASELPWTAGQVGLLGCVHRGTPTLPTKRQSSESKTSLGSIDECRRPHFVTSLRPAHRAQDTK